MVEEEGCVCIEEAGERIGIDVENEISEFQEYLIEKKILQNNSGKALWSLMKKIHENGVPVMEYNANMEKLIRLCMDSQYILCKARFSNNEVIINSKHNEFIKQQNEALNSRNLDLKKLIKPYFEVYNPEDFDRKFLKWITLIGVANLIEPPGIPQMTPNKVPDDVRELFETEMLERNVLDVKITDKDILYVNGKITKITELKKITKEFMQNPESRTDFPAMVKVSVPIAEKKIDSLDNELKAIKDKNEQDPKIAFLEADLEDWKTKKEAAELVGTFHTLPKLSIISLRNSNQTSYSFYIKVLNQLQEAINELRNMWAQKIYKEDYTDWNPSRTEDQKKLKIVRAIIPTRIAEQEPDNIPTY